MSLRCVVALVVIMVMQCACQDPECYDAQHPDMYIGHEAVTETGTPCQPWVDQSPHAHTMGDDASDFVDGEFPSNYCRVTLNAEDDAHMPWCYTSDEYVRWEYCDVPQCACTGDFVVYGSSCFAYVNSSTSWLDAQTHCSSLGGFLAEIKATDQSDFIRDLNPIGGQGAWLGGKFDIYTGKWKWASSGEEMTYTNWAIGEPVHAKDCLSLREDNMWAADVCSVDCSYLCQKTPHELHNGGRINILGNVVDGLLTAMANMTNVIQDMTQIDNEIRQELLEARHIEHGTFKCGNFDLWTTYEQNETLTFDTAYLAPPTVHVSLATLDTNVNKRHLDVAFAVIETTYTGFKVECKSKEDRHASKLWELDLTWISIPSQTRVE